jgi:hypothetical protein
MCHLKSQSGRSVVASGNTAPVSFPDAVTTRPSGIAVQQASVQVARRDHR